MRRVSGLLTGCLLVLAVTEAEHFSQPGRRVCSAAVESHTVSFLVSHTHPIYQPYLTVCQGQRLCSTYSTTYRVSHRRVYRTIFHLAHRCCPGWRRASGHTWLGCNTAVCQPPCQNGGKCSFPNKCTCPVGWIGRWCQTDVDECAGGRHDCSQACLNVAGSYSCSCQKGHKLRADGKTCQAPEAPTSLPGIATPEKTIMLGKVKGSRKRGRPNRRRRDSVKEAMKALGVQDLSRADSDGTFWGRVIYRVTIRWKRSDGTQHRHSTLGHPIPNICRLPIGWFYPCAKHRSPSSKVQFSPAPRIGDQACLVSHRS